MSIMIAQKNSYAQKIREKPGRAGMGDATDRKTKEE
jgi:hypothetical protein